MAAPRTHNSNEISVNFAGRDIDIGRADGDFCTTAFSVERFTKKVGADGQVTRSKNNDSSGTATIKLMSTSPGHLLLLQLDAIGRASPNGGDIAPFQLRDRNGGIVEHAEHAWIEKAPDDAYGKEVGEREWVLGLADLERLVEEVG